QTHFIAYALFLAPYQLWQPTPQAKVYARSRKGVAMLKVKSKSNIAVRNLAMLAVSMIASLCLSAPVLAQGIVPATDPEGAGFVPQWLDRIGTWHQSQISAGAFPGAVVAIARKGKLAYLQAIGTQDRAGKVPLKTDAIFWIASMTKPVISVAA